MAIDRTLAVQQASMVLISIGLTPPDMLVLLNIAGHENQERRKELDEMRENGEITVWDKRYFPSYSQVSAQTIGYETGIPYSTVRRSIKLLVTMRILMVRPGRIRQPSWYAVNPEVMGHLCSKAKEAKEAYEKIRDEGTWSHKRQKLIEVNFPPDLGANPDPSYVGHAIAKGLSKAEDNGEEELDPEDRSSVPPARSQPQYKRYTPLHSADDNEPAKPTPEATPVIPAVIQIPVVGPKEAERKAQLEAENQHKKEAEKQACEGVTEALRRTPGLCDFCQAYDPERIGRSLLRVHDLDTVITAIGHLDPETTIKVRRAYDPIASIRNAVLDRIEAKNRGEEMYVRPRIECLAVN